MKVYQQIKERYGQESSSKIIFELWSEKITQKDRQVSYTEISLEKQIFHRQSLLTCGYGLVHQQLDRDTAICKCFTY